MIINHIAILVKDIDETTSMLPDYCILQEKEKQPQDGSIEQYVIFDGPEFPSLLLIQKTADGPFNTAINKRGYGLHHFGAAVNNINNYLGKQNYDPRFLLHPISLKTIKNGYIWLCRPGIPFLIELMERNDCENITGKFQINLPNGTVIPSNVMHIFQHCSLGNSVDDSIEIQWNDKKIKIFINNTI